MIGRAIENRLKKAISGEKSVILVYGPRQAGKTTLIKNILSGSGQKYDYYTGDDLRAQEIFSRNELDFLKGILTDKILVVDEAQKIENIGNSLKLIHDNLAIRIIASGSASFDLAGKISEPLTGRTKIFWLYPLSCGEVKERYRKTSPRTALEEMLRFGMYPKAHTLESEKEKEKYLLDYLNNYLYKDILSFSGVRKPKKVVDLLILLALQIGREATVSELAERLAISQVSVEKYLDVLEKMFVIFNLRGFSRNLRKEISKTSKYYFWDLGLRNALIRNFNPLHLRSDKGDMFENWFVMEKIKVADIFDRPANFYFWRTYDQKEIDLIEEREGKLSAYEVEWSQKKDVLAPADWRRSYPDSFFSAVNSQNYFDFLDS